LKGTSHSFPQSAQVALCISLLLYIRYFNSYYFGCAKVSSAQYHLTIVDAYKLSASVVTIKPVGKTFHKRRFQFKPEKRTFREEKLFKLNCLIPDFHRQPNIVNIALLGKYSGN
jgi:hypothetical protein